MVAITKEEKKKVLEKYPGTHIRRTAIQKSRRHRYYMEESRRAMRLLNEIRQKG